MAVCTKCVDGTYSGTAGATTSATCLTCPSGSYCPMGSGAPTLCRLDTMRAATGGMVATDCRVCAGGTYSSNDGTACLSPLVNCASAFVLTRYATCPGGMYGSQYSCTNVLAGTYKPNDGYTAGTPCLAGTYMPSCGATACLPCPIGYSCAGTGLSSATACPAGSYSGATSTTACTPCAAGYYSATTGATAASACQICWIGTYTPAGASACTPCAAGFASNVRGATVCTACDAGTTSGTGATYCYATGSTTAYLGIGVSQTCKWMYFNDYTAACWGNRDCCIWNENNNQAIVTGTPSTYCSGTCRVGSAPYYEGVTTDLTWQWDSQSFFPSNCAACYQPVGSVANCASSAPPVVQQCFFFDASSGAGCNRWAHGTPMCHSCNAGYYSAVPWFTTCAACQAGTYSTGVGLLDTTEPQVLTHTASVAA